MHIMYSHCHHCHPLRFHYLVRSEGSPLKDRVKQMVVATNESTRLPQDWQWSGAKHRRYTQEEIERREEDPSLLSLKIEASKKLLDFR